MWSHPLKILTIQGAAYLAAVLEYFSGELLELAGNVAKKQSCKAVTSRHLLLAMQGDAELCKMLGHGSVRNDGVTPDTLSASPDLPTTFDGWLRSKCSEQGTVVDPRSGTYVKLQDDELVPDHTCLRCPITSVPNYNSVRCTSKLDNPVKNLWTSNKTLHIKLW